jgi:hypothetical protein
VGRCVLLDETSAELLEFQFHVCNIRAGEEAVWVCPLEELQHLSGGRADSKKTVNCLLDSSSASPAPVASQGESIERTVIVMCLPVTDLPSALRVHRIGGHDRNAHGTIHACTLAIKSLSGLVGELAGVGGLAMPATMHVAFVQYAFGVLLARATHELVSML